MLKKRILEVKRIKELHIVHGNLKTKEKKWQGKV